MLETWESGVMRFNGVKCALSACAGGKGLY